MVSKKNQRRLYVITALGCCYVAVLVFKLFSVQVVGAEFYRKKAQKQHERFIKLEPERGIIYDRNGEKLAININANSYGIDFSKFPANKRKRTAWLFSTKTPETYDQLYRRIKYAKSYRWVARKVPKKYEETIDGWKLPRLYRTEETLRSYPFGSLASHILGFTNVDNRGIEGVELMFNNRLRGMPGETVLQIDARGYLQPNFKSPLKKPVNGTSVVLTIDAEYQKIVEEELARTVRQFDASSGSIVLIHPATGEILAMASLPTFDPNQVARSSRAARRNRAITDLYEPGSTFKLIPLTAALNEKLVAPADRIFCENGRMKLHTTYIHDSHKYDWLTFREVISHSSNIGTAKIAKLIGDRRLYQYARSFGFGALSGINMPGEVGGVLRNPSSWSKLSLSMVSFGQEISATPLQVANAYAAIANGGVLMQPLIIKKLVNAAGETVQEYRPRMIRRVVKEDVARTVTSFLEEVVQKGTAVRTRIEGIRIAGKTGTAQKSEPGKGYVKGAYVSSFAGYLPAEDPQLVCLVVVDEPKKGYYASEVAVPAFRRIMERIIESPHSDLKHYFFETVPVNVKPVMHLVSIPDIRGLSVLKATEHLADEKLVVQRYGTGGTVIAQVPAAGTEVPAHSPCAIITRTEGPEQGVVPEVTGLSLREAVAAMAARSIAFKVKGSGTVVKQSHRPGTRLGDQRVCVVECKPES